MTPLAHTPWTHGCASWHGRQLAFLTQPDEAVPFIAGRQRRPQAFFERVEAGAP